MRQSVFTEEDVCLFRNRFENGYDLYHDNRYVDWLRQEHPDSLPDGLVNNEQIDTSVTLHPSTMTDMNTLEPSTMVNTEDQEETAKQISDTSANCSIVSQVGEAGSDDVSSTSLSSSLSVTRKLISELSELINPPKTSTGKNKGKAKARVLTSEDSLKELIDKEKKKRDEEELKKKKREERERKRIEKQEEKSRKAEIRQKKMSTRKQSKESTVVGVLDSESTESGVQSNEISSNECALCFGLYEEDLSMTGKLEREWVQCINATCGKWMHAECLNIEDGMFVCGLCSMLFC